MEGKPLAGRVALVTGASRGIGREIAVRFARDGAFVVVNHRDSESAAAEVVRAVRAAGGAAEAIGADVSVAADVERLVGTVIKLAGRIDILVNNAGVHVARDLFDTTETDWDRTIDVNLKGAYLCSKAAAAPMLHQGYGRIIMMSSNSGLYHPSAMRFTEYVVSKAGMNGLTKALALRLGPAITVNAICPGWIRTDMIDDIDPSVHAAILDETALRRWGTPADVAGAAAFLASPDADFVTGELLIVAGGRGMH